MYSLGMKGYRHDYYLRNAEKIKARTQARYRANREKEIAYQKEYAQRFPDKIRAWRKGYYAKNKTKLNRQSFISKLRVRYGLTPEELEQMKAAQKGVCAICNRPSRRTLNVDHDHKTGKVRELLCHSCNRAIGLLEDNPNFVEAAQKYLLKHS